MGTANFHTVNAEDIYVKYDRWQDEEDGDLVFREWDELNEEIISLSAQDDWDVSTRPFKFGRERDYSVLSKEYWFEYSNSGLKYRIDVYITLNSGYYEHCNLDYRFVLDGSDNDDSIDDIIEMMVDDFSNGDYSYPLSYSSVNKPIWNNGMRKLQRDNFKRGVEKFFDFVKEECERKCKALCDNEYKLVCRASNGEAFYEKVT